MHVTAPLTLIVTALFCGAAAADIAVATHRAKSGLFDNAADVRCAQEVGQALGSCSADVARADGAAVVVVGFPNGFTRMLSFVDGEFLRGNPTMSGVGTDMEWNLSGGLYEIRVDDQRFEIPEALVSGE